MGLYLCGTVYRGKKTACFTDFPMTSCKQVNMKSNEQEMWSHWKAGYLIFVTKLLTVLKRELVATQNSQRVSVGSVQSHSPSFSWQSAKTFGDKTETAKGSLRKSVGEKKKSWVWFLVAVMSLFFFFKRKNNCHFYLSDVCHLVKTSAIGSP